MIRTVLSLTLVSLSCQPAWCQTAPPKKPKPAAATTADSKHPAEKAEVKDEAKVSGTEEVKEPAEHAVMRERMNSYVEAFNKHDAEAVAGYWAKDALSVVQKTGERIVGREALQQDFDKLFKEQPRIQLSGVIETIRLIRDDVACIDGQTTIVLEGADPVPSAFSVVLVKDDGQWLISSSHESEVTTPATPGEALRELEWMIGTWQDQSDEVQVTTTVRWSANRAFLIRSFDALLEDEESFEGTQVIGWDPRSKQIRTWSFYSDGSFGEGTVSRSDNEWSVKMSHILDDGRILTATQVITQMDDDTMTVQTIAQTIDGEPMPTPDPITVVRVADEAAVSESDPSEKKGAAQ